MGPTPPGYGSPPLLQAAYYAPHAAYATPQMPQVPLTIGVPAHQAWKNAGQQEFNTMRDRGGNGFNTGRGKKHCTDNRPFVPMPSNTTNQWPNTGTYQGGTLSARNQNNKNVPFSNKVKNNMNLLYCYSCGYDVDHNGYNCPDPKGYHIPNVKRDVTHEVPRTCMCVQHKVLPDGIGAGKGWILAQSIMKAKYVMNDNQQWSQQNQQRRSGGRRGNNRRGSRNQNQNWQQSGGNQQWHQGGYRSYN